MGGQDKGLVTIGGQTMIQRVIARFGPQVNELAISANRNQSEYSSFGYTTLSDETDDFRGPLAGIQQGLEWCHCDYLAVVPCDSPRLPLNLVACLSERLHAQGRTIALASADGFRQPVFALVEKNLCASLQAFLDAGERKIGKWFESHNAVEVEFDDIGAFANINTDQDLKSLELEIQ
jgi:molybdenum cofactor guanylyltransferase